MNYDSSGNVNVCISFSLGKKLTKTGNSAVPGKSEPLKVQASLPTVNTRANTYYILIIHCFKHENQKAQEI